MGRTQNGVRENSDMFFYSFCRNCDLFYYPLSAGHFYCDKNYRIEREGFNSILIMFIKNGRLNFSDSGTPQTVSAGETAVIDCFGKHFYGSASDELEAYWIHISGANTHSLYCELIQRHGNIFGASSEAEDKILNLYEIIKNSETVSDLEMSLKIYELTVSLFSGRYADRESFLIRKAVNYISDNYSENITVKNIADSVNMSEAHFSRIFKKATGTSPYEFVLNKRTAKAKELLKNTDLQVSEIAYLTGFSDPSSFIYFFRQKEGISPMKFRKMLF